LPDLVVLVNPDPETVVGHEKGVRRLMERCPWIRQEHWSVDALKVYAMGNKYEFPEYAKDGSGRSIILCGHIRLDDIEDRAGGREGFDHFSEDILLNSLFNLWLRKGKESLCGLNGRYALILWDEKERELSVATDFFGNRHIYYLYGNGHISFSTNLSILTCSPHFNRDLDPQGIIESLCLGYQLEERTLFSGIKIVPPSSLLVFKGGEIKLKEIKRFVCSEPRHEIEWDNAIEEFHDVLLDSLKKRIRTDADYIIPLSGGLDSRCITGLSHALGLNCHFYTYGLKGCKDMQIAPRVASAVGATTELTLNKPDYILRRWGDPFLLDGDMRIPTISVFIDFLEHIGPDRGIFISGFMGETITGNVYQFIRRKDSFYPPENFFSLNDLASFLKIPDWEDMAQEIPVTLTKIRDGFTGNDYVKDLMLDIVTRQRRFFSFQERLIEYYGGLITPFEDVKVLEFILSLPFIAMVNQELYRRFQVRYFPELAKVPSVNYGPLLTTAKSVLSSALSSNLKNIKRYLKGPSFNEGSVYPVNHSESIRHDGVQFTEKIFEYRDELNDIFDIAKIQQLMDVHMRGDNRGTRKILAMLHILSGLNVCRNGVMTST
jgi:hypothetical protein